MLGPRFHEFERILLDVRKARQLAEALCEVFRMSRRLAVLKLRLFPRRTFPRTLETLRVHPALSQCFRRSLLPRRPALRLCRLSRLLSRPAATLRMGTHPQRVSRLSLRGRPYQREI